MSANPTPSSSTSDITSVTNSTQTREVQTSTATPTNKPASMDASNPNCCPPFGTKRSASEPIQNATVAPPDAAATTTNSHQHNLQLLDLITKDLHHVEEASKNLKNYGDLATTQIKKAFDTLEILRKDVSTGTPHDEESIEKDVEEELLELKKSVMKLKLQIPSKYKPQSGSESDANKNQRSNDSSSVHGKTIRARKLFDKVPDLCKNKAFEESKAFKDLKALYDGLDIQEKVCLLSFSVFPENEIIKKRFMLYWWIGEGFVRPTPAASDRTAEELASDRTAEELASDVFNELMAKGFIEPFNEKRSLGVNRCKMHPFVRAAVVVFADRAKIFDFDSKGKPTGNFKFSLRACLLKEKKLKDDEDLEKVHTLFNVDETILEFEKPEMFSRMKNINVFCLGRWQTSPKYHIEIEDPKLLEGLMNMRHLKFLSLQGISRIMKLPDSISNLANLTILDIRACHNLEEIPNKIGSLQSLTHLDMAECYLLDNMPKELSSLLQLQVLKGFVVGDPKGKNSCTLKHLANLPKLRKLCIYTGREDFPTDEELKSLYKFKVLRKLTIAWGGGSQGKSDNRARPEKNAGKSTVAEPTTEPQNPGKNSGKSTVAETTIGPQNLENGGNDIEHDNTGNAAESRAPTTTTKRSKILQRFPTMRRDRNELDFALPDLPTELEKLDLKCFPKKFAPNWLEASKLSKIKKLYIRGGTLGDLGQFQLKKYEWKKVEILRLKFLSELEMDWTDLQELFPKLNYLEKVKCPKLTLFPCDGHGVWMRKPERSKKL